MNCDYDIDIYSVYVIYGPMAPLRSMVWEEPSFTARNGIIAFSEILISKLIYVAFILHRPSI